MSRPERVWEAYLLSKQYRTRPSELYGIIDEVEAFCFDRAVFLFGTSLQGELDAVSEKTKQATENKRRRILAKWIPQASAGFRDPAKIGS